MQTSQQPKSSPPHAQPKAPPPRPQAKQPKLSRRTRLFLIVGGAIVGVAVLALVAVNLLISADAVRDRVAKRIKEQTGRELKVNGTTALLFAPGPHVIITDATFTDPEARAGTSDFSVARLVIDLNLFELMSRQVDAERVVLERPVLTLRLGKDDRQAKPKQAKAANPGQKHRRDMKLKDVRIEDGTVNIVYDQSGTARRIEHISANLSLPTLTAPFTGHGKLDWKDQSVDFNFELTSLADLRQKRPAKLVLAVDTSVIAARFDGNLLTKPDFSGEGDLTAKAHSIPSLLAWMREKPAVATGIGDGQLSSHIAWKNDEITLSDARFALEHASGQGQAVVTLKSPRPHVRAALALDYLDLNPFLPSGQAKAAGSGANHEAAAPSAAAQAGSAVPRQAPESDVEPPAAAQPKDWFTKPDQDQGATATEPAPAPETPDTQAAQSAPDVAPAPASPPVASEQSPPSASPASFDADVNLNVRKTRVSHLELGPSSLGLAFRDGVLNATLGGMELYGGHANGKLVLDASKTVPAFTGNFLVDGVEAKPLLSDAAQFSLLEGHAKLTLQISGAGSTSDEIKSSLAGQGNIAVSDGSIEGIDITEMISQVGAGQIPELRQGSGAKTAFSDLGGSFTISGGVAETNNLQMTSPLLKVAAAGTVDLTQSTINMLATPEIVAGAEGQGGANDLAGLSVPVRIEGPLDRPTIRPELKGMFANPEKARKTVRQIGEALQKKFKGKPVGEAIGRFLGNVQIGTPDQGGNGAAEPQTNRKRSKKEAPSPAPNADSGEQGDNAEPEPDDPDLDRILR
jgi:AsmA protein